MFLPSLLIVILLTVNFCEAYTVVTRSGKRISGTLISEDDHTIVIKDSQGFAMSFKKQTIDLMAMQHANAAQTSRNELEPEEPELKRTTSLVELANKTKAQRTGNSRLLTLENLAKTPEVSIIGSDLPVATGKTKEQTNDETAWARRLSAMKKEVNRLMERKISAEAKCNQSKRKQYEVRTTGHEKPSDLLQTYKRTAECEKFEEIARQFEDAQTDLEDAREEGRRAGISWQTLE
jgi:hypothetical protein